MIGLGVSFCVPDIASGRVQMSEVVGIYHQPVYSSWRNEKKWLLGNLNWCDWRLNPEACEKILRQLISNTKRAKRGKDPKGPILIECLGLGIRKLDAKPKSLANWVNFESDIEWHH